MKDSAATQLEHVSTAGFAASNSVTRMEEKVVEKKKGRWIVGVIIVLLVLVVGVAILAVRRSMKK